MDSTAKRRMRLIVNGKAASDPLLRPAISQIRDIGHQLEVRVTWEGGDAALELLPEALPFILGPNAPLTASDDA